MEPLRRRRLDRYRRPTRPAALHLVSLMDIFTILVFFMLVNSSAVEEAPATKAVKLPESIADTALRQTVVVMVTDKDVLLQDQPIAPVSALLESPEPVFAPLKRALEAQAARSVLDKSEDRGEVTIIGDKEISYSLLRKIMATCTEAGFSQVSLAVLQKQT